MKVSFEVVLLRICNYQYTPERIYQWVEEFADEFKLLLGDDYFTLLELIPSQKNEITLLLAGVLGMQTVQIRIDHTQCMSCHEPRLTTTLGSFRSYGEFIAVSTRESLYFHVHVFNENKEVFEDVSHTIEKMGLRAEDIRTLTQRAFCGIVDSYRDLSFDLQGYSRKNSGCANCGLQQFTPAESFEGLILSGSFKNFKSLTNSEKQELIYQMVKSRMSSK